MAIRYVLGRSGSGKTRRCLDDIRAQLQQAPDGPPLVLLVPEQATFQAEHALVSTPGLGGTIRAQVLSFRRLAYRIMQEAGGTARIHIDDSGKKMLLYDLLHKHREELRHYQASADQMGFIDNLNRMYDEFRRYCVTPDKLESFIRNRHREEQQSVAGMSRRTGLLGDKLHDLLLVYRAFEEQLSKMYIDSEHLLTKMAEVLPESAYARAAHVWIDGFVGFTPQELLVIGQLMRSCQGVTVTLCVDRDYGAGDTPDELDLFHPAARTLVRLKQIADELGVGEQSAVVLEGTPPRFARSPMLAHLERSLETRRPVPFIGQSSDSSPSKSTRGIDIYAAVNRRAEVEGTAREIVRLVRDEGCRWREIAVMVRNLESYGDLLAVTLSDYGIPYFLDMKRSVLHHPLVELIRSSLETVSGRWSNDAVFRCVKTDLLFRDRDEETGGDAVESANQMRDAMSRLENYVLAAGIQGARWKEKRPWTYKVGSMLDDVQEQSASASDDALLREVNRLRGMIVKPLESLETALKEAASAMEMAGALYAFLEQIGAPAKLERWSRDCLDAGQPEKAREHTQVWGSVVDLLDQIVEMMGEDPLTLKRFTGLIDAGLESIRLGLVPPSLDQVLIGTMDRTRSGTVSHVFVLGANDGIMPAKPTEDGVLSEPERERLLAGGLELAEGSRRKLLDESFLLYAALTAPSDSLWISYPLADEEGKSLLPSELIKRLKTMFPSVRERLLFSDPPIGDTVSDADSSALAYLAHPGRALSYLAVQLRMWLRGSRLDPMWWHVYNWLCTQPDWRDKLQATLRSLLHTNRADKLPASVSRPLYGDLLRASVSRMERFAACPFSQFASHGLRLKERQLYRLDAPDIGQLFHAALSRIALELQKEGVGWSELSAEQLFDRASRAVDELAPRLQGEILLSSKRYGYIARKLKMVVGRASAVLGEHARRGEFVPIGLEVGFGPGQSLPSLQFRLDNGSLMEIVGRIDRVDRADSERGMLLRIIDYKSSDTSLRMAELFYGMSLQMLTYLDVVITHAEQWLGRSATPAGVLYFHVHNPLLVRKNVLSREEAEAQMLKKFKMKGLLLEDPEAVQLMDVSFRERGGHSQLIPAALKADGTFYKNSSVASEKQWDQLREYVRGTIRRIGDEITGGTIDIRPSRMGPKLACTFCPYKPVCQFEPMFEGNEYHKLQKMNKEAVWDAINVSASAVQADTSEEGGAK